MATLSPEEERLISLWLLQKMPTATETMVEKWWQGICQGVVRRRLEAAKNRIKLPELSAGEIVTTGTLTDAQPLVAGQRWQTRLGNVPLAGLRLSVSG